MKKTICTVIATLSAALVQAGRSPQLTIKNVRTYETSFIVQVAENVNASCSFPDHLQLSKSNPNYQASVSLFMTAWTSGKKIQAYYNGCDASASASGGNVNVTGWYVY
ncbi:hypothetical protein [Aliikangiella maris]|uniref:Uncharacterized protein n=2 Tax=Aliikangiella maris TaxID=3162458 RepID=A0ABV3MQ11_9GAMM